MSRVAAVSLIFAVLVATLGEGAAGVFLLMNDHPIVGVFLLMSMTATPWTKLGLIIERRRPWSAPMEIGQRALRGATTVPGTDRER